MTSTHNPAEAATAEDAGAGGTQAHELRAATRAAVDAIDRATALLGPQDDPLMAATASALACADALMRLHRGGRHQGHEDIAALREAVGAARALVVEVTYALRDRYGSQRR